MTGQPPPPFALRMSGISKSFGAVNALRRVSFDVRPATVHALCGENGAGKSTLMKVLAGVHRPDEGRIEIGGRDWDFREPSDAFKAGVAMIYQELDLAEDLSVAENVFLGAEPRRLGFALDLSACVAATAALIRESGFRLDPNARVGNLSTGDCQLVEILKALRKKAQVLVMDEPTSSLSLPEARRLFDVVRDLKKRGISIIYISHRLEEVEALSDDVSVLRDGQVVYRGAMADTPIKTLVAHMVGRDLSDFYPAHEARPGEVRLSVEGLGTAAGLRDISFDLRAGEVVGLAGLVGAGRSELARALFGIDRLTSGTLHLSGKPFLPANPSQAIARRIGFLTEDRKRSGLCLGLESGWNITLPCLGRFTRAGLLSPGREERASAEAGRRVRVKWAGPSSPARSLSGGNQQKLLLARWLLAEVELLIVDEPTRGVDVGAKREIYQLIHEMAASGRAVLFISSELPELLGVTDRILVMRRGRLVGSLRTAEATPQAIMQLAAVGETAPSALAS